MASKLGISSRTIAKISKGERLSAIVLSRIAEFLGCEASELMVYVPDNPILRTLLEEKRFKVHGGLYHELQVHMAYNSNHIEGSRLSERQTRMIFETNTIGGPEVADVDDIIETSNHFKALDYVIEIAEKPLTEDLIKRLHYMLKKGTSAEKLPWFEIGDYKKRENVVGGRETSKPSEVRSHMKELLSGYNSIASVSLEDIVAFHVRFERIHPFQDGNGRVGRLIALKECLHHGIVPFLIDDSKKMFYYRGLSEWGHVDEYLLDTCRDGQDAFRQIMSSVGVHLQNS